MRDFLDQSYFGNSVYDYAVALGIFILGIFVLKIFKKIILSKFKKWSEKTETKVDDFLIKGIEKSILPVLYLIIFYFAVKSLTLHKTAERIIDVATVILITFYVIKVITSALSFSLLSGEQVIVSNTDLTNSRIQNFKRMERRRIVFKLGVVYQTTAKQLEEIPNLVRSIIEEQPDIAFDRGHFQSYGNFSLDFEFVYFVLSPDYNKYMDIQQAINLKIYNEFEKGGIEFAYPTQTLFLTKENGNAEYKGTTKSDSERN